MNKKEFIDFLVQEKLCATKKEAASAVEVFTKGIGKAVEKNQEVSLVGFGSFKIKMRKGKTAKIPGQKKGLKKPKTYTLPDRMAVSFKIGKTLKETAEKIVIA